MFVKLPVRKKDLVLEIGSGHNPHPRSDVLCDRYLLDNTERQRQVIKIDRPLVIAKGEKLPFANKSFDYIYSAQVLEHAKNPLQFIKELSRVGKSGLIIVPNIVRERLFGWSYHRWYFFSKNKKIFFLEKKNNEFSGLGRITHKLFEETWWFKRSITNLEKELNIYYFWQKNPILFKVDKRKKQKILSDADKIVDKILKTIKPDYRKDLIFFITWNYKRIINKIIKILIRLNK